MSLTLTVLRRRHFSPNPRHSAHVVSRLGTSQPSSHTTTPTWFTLQKSQQQEGVPWLIFAPQSGFNSCCCRSECITRHWYTRVREEILFTSNWWWKLRVCVRVCACETRVKYEPGKGHGRNLHRIVSYLAGTACRMSTCPLQLKPACSDVSCLSGAHRAATPALVHSRPKGRTDRWCKAVRLDKLDSPCHIQHSTQ